MSLLRILLIPFSILYYLFQLIRNKLFDLNIFEINVFPEPIPPVKPIIDIQRKGLIIF